METGDTPPVPDHEVERAYDAAFDRELPPLGALDASDTPEPADDKEAALARITSLVAEVAQTEQRLKDTRLHLKQTVDTARERGALWREIGEAAGTDKHKAIERWSPGRQEGRRRYKGPRN